MPDQLDTDLLLLLTGVTAAQGLAFSRAMLFLTDRTRKCLQGRMGVGALTREDAEGAWKWVKERTAGFGDQTALEFLLDRAQETKASESRFCAAVRGQQVPLDLTSGAPALSVIEGKAVVRQGGVDDRFRDVLTRLTFEQGLAHQAAAGAHTVSAHTTVEPPRYTGAFACVPLVREPNGPRVLIADRAFLHDSGRIDEGLLHCLETFAGVAALVIKNAELQDQIEKQKLAGWWRVMRRVWDLAGPPLENIHREVRFLEGYIQNHMWGQARSACEQVERRIVRLSQRLNDAARFPLPVIGAVRLADLLQRIRDGGKNEHVRCQPQLDCRDPEIRIECDPEMLAGVIVKLIVIRDDAMQEGGKRPPMIRVSGEAERHDHAVRIEIIDNGPHIPKELKELMFSPYFFPESDNHLVIVRDVIELHSGHIEERGTVDSGAHFVIHIPQLAIES